MGAIVIGSFPLRNGSSAAYCLKMPWAPYGARSGSRRRPTGRHTRGASVGRWHASSKLSSSDAAAILHEDRRLLETRRIAELDHEASLLKVDWPTVRAQLTARAAEWRAILSGHVPQARQLLRKLLVGSIRLFPNQDAPSRTSLRGHRVVRSVLTRIYRSNFGGVPDGNRTGVGGRNYTDVGDGGVGR
jgi:hypothetical protein